MNKKNFDETDVTISIITHICDNPKKMKTISEKELVNALSEEFINNQKITKSTVGKQEIIKRVTNKFIRKRKAVSNVPNWRENFINRVIVERGTTNLELFKILEIKPPKELTEQELEWLIDNVNQAKDVMRNLDKYTLNSKLAIALTKAWVFHITDLIPTHWIDSLDHVHLMNIEYADFWIEENDINYLHDMSVKIQNEKISNHSTFRLEDEIDEYFKNKQYN